jgi:hypothetical protein
MIIPCIGQAKEDNIVVFVHGTKVKSILRLFPLIGHVLNWSFKNAIAYLDGFTDGLHEIKSFDNTQTSFPTAICASLKEGMKDDANIRFYQFGWSGSLSMHARKKAGGQFLSALCALRQESFCADVSVPKMMIITHSHGGNVFLEMLLQNNGRLPKDAIDEVLLLACPVQEETKKAIASDTVCKRIIQAISYHDIVQRLDPQGLWHFFNTFSWGSGAFFSERFFPHAAHLTQLEIGWKNKKAVVESMVKMPVDVQNLFKNGGSFADKIFGSQRGSLHEEMLTPSFLVRVPEIIKWCRDKRSTGQQFEYGSLAVTVY